jgi:excisionase family DNA binding protein
MKKETILPRFMTLDEIALLTKRSRRSLYVDIALGKLKTTKLGRSVRVSEEDYLAYVKQGRR